MARRRNVRGRPTVVNKDQIWIPTVINGALSADQDAEFPIVSGSDWAASGVGLERATFLSARGYISLHMNFEANSNNFVALAVALMHEDAGLPSLATEAAYIEDILWTGGQIFRNEATVGVSGASIQYNAVFDIKARRRITDQQNVSLFIRPNGFSAVAFAVIRCLVRRA